jgi:outer membrane protein assembly factor BamB
VIEHTPIARPDAVGAIPPGGAGIVGEHLVWVESVAAGRVGSLARCLRVDGDAAAFASTTVWEHGLSADSPQSTDTAPVPPGESVVRAGPARVLLISRAHRELVDVTSGDVLAVCEGDAVATGPSRMVGDLLWVPEGPWVTLYDADTLAVVERCEVPNGYWAYGADRRGVVVLRDAHGSTTRRPLQLWFRGEPPIEIPAATYVAGPPAGAGNCVVVAGGVGPATELIAFNRSQRHLAWVQRIAPERDRAISTPPVSGVVVGAGDMIVAATSWPAIEAREPGSGELVWRSELSGEKEPPPVDVLPTAIALSETVVWAGMHGGAILALDKSSGQELGAASLDLPAGNIPRAIVPLAEGPSTPPSAIVVGAIGALTHVRLVPQEG